MADSRAVSPSAPRGPTLRPAALVLGAAVLAVAGLLLLAPVGGTLGMMLAVVVAFAVIHVGCLTVGCRGPVQAPGRGPGRGPGRRNGGAHE